MMRLLIAARWAHHPTTTMLADDIMQTGEHTGARARDTALQLQGRLDAVKQMQRAVCH